VLIRSGGKHISAAVDCLGMFDTKQEAALAHDREARQCGAKKPLNYESMEGAEEAATKAQAKYALSRGPPQPKRLPAPGYYGVYASRKLWSASIVLASETCYPGTSAASTPSRRRNLRNLRNLIIMPA
jgi:hypothetical protein